MERKPRRRRPSALIPVLFFLLILAAAVLVFKGFDALTHRAAAPRSETIATTLPVQTVQSAEKPQVVATANLASLGDLLMHRPIIESCMTGSESYDFSSLFRYIKEELHGFDYCVANLETSLGGPDCGIRYQGSPLFNCPDAIADAASAAGIQMLLTANNHCADTGADGVLRTLEVVRSKGLATLGTSTGVQEAKHAVVDVNGIKLGMLCYTYATSSANDGAPGFNYNDPIARAGLINYYLPTDLPGLYAQVSAALEQLRQAGADATIVYIHWGPEEYQLQANSTQCSIAQKLCDLGVDVIIGGHPHVVEPMALLCGTDNPDHKTICIYSLGNAVSNQRREEMTATMPDGHTEDGAALTITFEKYSDGQVYIRQCDVLPLWVNKFSNGTRYEYNILPLEHSQSGSWAQRFGLDADTLSNAQASFQRTMALVGPGLAQCQSYLSQAKELRDLQ